MMAQNEEKPAAWIGEGNNAFAMDLYGKLAPGADGNLFFSPVSIEAALGMTYSGARGATAKEMGAVLHLPPSGEAMQKELGDYLKGLKGGEDYSLSVANALWGAKGFGFLPDFTQMLKADYGAGLEELDFARDEEGARGTINGWVEKATQEKIKDLIPTGILGPETALVLTNAIYFKGSWLEPFEEKRTQQEAFHLAGGTDKKVPVMHATGWHPYMENDECQAMELGYKGGRLSMVILLPRKVDGLPGLEADLAKVPGWLGQLKSESVNLAVPKFEMEWGDQLNDALQKLGMKSAFLSSVADFSGMTGSRDLSISAVIHKAYVKVDERGTEAAAATAVVMTKSAMPMEQASFRADHPFLFVIRDNISGAILFMGRVMEPK
jgi:serpin B